MRSPAKNFILLSSSEVVSKALGFFTTVVIARRVGVNGLGDLGFVLAVYTYFTLLANPGYDTIGARETAKRENDASSIINSLFRLKFWSSILAFVVLVLFCFVVPFSSSVKQLLMLQGLSLLTIPFSFQFYFRGGNQMHVVALSRFLQSSMYFLAVYFGVRGIGDLTRVPLSFGIATVLGLLPMVGLLRQHFSLRQTIPWERLRFFFISAITIGAAAICVQIYLNMDTVLLGFFKTSREVGLYTSAYKIVTLASTIPMLIFTSYLPHLVSIKDKVTADWKMYILSMFSVGLPVGISVALLAPTGISLLYGIEYQGAVLPLRILSIDIIAVFASITFAQPLLLLGKEKQYLSIVAWSAGFNLLFNLFMIPLFGMTGAALTTVCAESMVAIRSWKAIKREVASTFSKEIIEILFITGAALLLMFLFKAIFTWNSAIAGGSFIIFYCILIVLWYLAQTKTIRGTT
jgi:O-antigen/teichoic acid export membrane protein